MRERADPCVRTLVRGGDGPSVRPGAGSAPSRQAVHLRGLVEIGNVCRRNCLYCGLRAGNPRVHRYRMTANEILACAREAAGLGLGTVVLQSGEDPGMTPEWLADLVARIVAETGLAVTLSLGERARDALALWRDAGARRYLLRFETSDPALFATLHPDSPNLARRLAVLADLRALDYEVGSGFMVGLPGQTARSVLRDIDTCAALDLDMIGIGPFIAHPDTPLSRATPRLSSLLVTRYSLLSLSSVRRLCPDANIPATTAVQTLAPESGLEAALRAGANVVMPNLTPARYREAYAIYPGKAAQLPDPAAQVAAIEAVLARLGLERGTGPGDSLNALRRRAAADTQGGS